MSAISSVQVGLAGNVVWVRVDGRGTFQNSAGLKEFAAEMTRRGHRDFVVEQIERYISRLQTPMRKAA